MTQQLNELFLSEGKHALESDDKYIWKTVLRTGEWKVTPKGGSADKPLRVVRDGISNTVENVISLSEIVNAFNEEAFEHVTVPLAQNIADGDHADIAKNNTGFIRKLKIVDEDGISKLKAAFDFTEPDIKARVERGTIPNTSVGILYDFVRKSDAKKFPVALAHVALTHRPWIDKMEPFGSALSDDEDSEISSFEPLSSDNDKVGWKASESYKTIMNKIEQTLRSDNFELDDNWEVADVAPGVAKIFNKLAGIEWVASYTIDDGVAKLPPMDEWNLSGTKKVEAQIEPVIEDEQQGDPEPIVEAPAAPSLDPNNLQDASTLREERFAQNNSNNGRLNMSFELKSLNLSELPDDARAEVEALQEENRKLERTARKGEVEEKVNKWGDELGLSAMPGFLKQVRQILLSDDGNTAALLLSDDGKSEEKVTATDIVTRLIESLPKTEAGKIELAAQVDLGAGDHERPAETDNKPFEDRLKEARQALGKPVEAS